MSESATKREAETGAAPELDWARVRDLPCQLTVDVALPPLLLAEVAALRAGSVLETRWPVTRDVPLVVNGQRIAWCEFEIVREQLAVRLTEVE
jgi:flagellar motor switch/type III secretory pathway protein FliN